MMLNILSIDEGEEWLEPRPPVYWVKTQFEDRAQWIDGRFMKAAVRDFLANCDPAKNDLFAAGTKIGGTVSFRPIGKLIGA